MWDRVEPEGYGAIVDLSRYMKEHRFLDIKRFIPFLLTDESKKDTDLVAILYSCGKLQQEPTKNN